jgi:hypothetical protein
MNLKKLWLVILLGGLAVALSAPSAMAWPNRPVVGHNPDFRGPAPHGVAYGYHGQRPAWNHGNARGWQHQNQWQHRNPGQHHNQWNQRNAYGPKHQGAWGQRQEARQIHNPNYGRPNGPYTHYSNAAYQAGPRR